MAEETLLPFGNYDPETAAQEAEELAKSGAKFLKPKEGRNVYRFLPPPQGRTTPFVVAFEHYVNMPGQNDISFACPRMMSRGKSPCPLCAKMKQLDASGNKADRDRAKDLFPSRRVYAAVIDRGDPEKGVQILAFGKTIHKPLTELAANQEEGGEFSHPVDGFDILIKRKGTGLDTEYTVLGSRTNKPLAQTVKLMNEWLGNLPDLTVYLSVPTADEIDEMFDGRLSGDGEGAKQIGTSPEAKGPGIADDFEDAEFEEFGEGVGAAEAQAPGGSDDYIPF